MLDRYFGVPIGLLALLGCTPRPTADLHDPETTSPKIASPEKSGVVAQGPETRWVDISIEDDFGCAVDRAGSVYCWGRGPAADMELREIPPQPTSNPNYGVRKWGPPSRVDLVHDARKISTTTQLACAIVEDGRIRCWGAFRWGTPHVYDVPGITKAVDLDIGDSESCATLESGELWCWNANDFGIPRPRLEDAIAVSVGGSIACGLTRQSDMICWGQGVEDWHRHDAQLKQQRAPTFRPTPEQEQEFPDSFEVGRVPGALDLALTGRNTLCVLRGDGKVVCSDRDLFSVLRGEEMGMRELDGAQGVAELAAARWHVCARTLDEQALCWGRNIYGQLGDGGSVSREQAAPVAELGAVVDLAVTTDFSCALTRDDRIACWGFDRGEALAREEFHIHTIEGLRASSIAASANMSCAVDEAKKVRCWGAQSIDPIGIAAAATPSPTSLPPGNELVDITSNYWATCFLLSNGSLQCGRLNSFGPGSPTFSPMTTSADVLALANSHSPACTITKTRRKAVLECGQDFDQLAPEPRIKSPFDVSTANMRACVAHGKGKVSCFAQLPSWARPPVRELAPVAGISDAVALSSAMHHDCALRKNGRVTCWLGRIQSEQSEDGRTVAAVHYQMANSTDMGLEQIVQLVSGAAFHCALSKSGAVRCWDDNPEQTIWRSVPELGPDIVELAAGSAHTCARSKAGKVTCWGDDAWGQLGRVPSRVYLSPTTLKVD